MKRIAAVLLFVLLFCTACGTQKESASAPSDANAVVGAWQTPQSPEITPELSALTDKAFETFTGAQYEPVAFLAWQIASGMHYRLLCKTDSVLPDGTQTYSIVELSEDVNEGVRISDIVDSAVPTNLYDAQHLSGGWRQPDSPEVSKELRQSLQKTGTQNEPIACLASQVVAGRNYCILCKAADADDAYVFVYLYVDLQGNAQLTDVVRFTDGSDNATIE